MIDLQTVNQVHNTLIDVFGGSNGIRDLAALEAALARPFATFDAQDLYPTPVDKATAVFESILTNHPFIDGNKRTAYVIMRLTLMENDLDIAATENNKYDFVMSASMGTIRFDEIKSWIELNLIPKN